MNIYIELKRIIDFIWLGITCIVDGSDITEDFNIINGVSSMDWLNSDKSPSHTMAQGIAIKKGIPIFVMDTLEEKYPIDRELYEKNTFLFVFSFEVERNNHWSDYVGQ